MNIFAVEKCGHITENDDFAVFMQNVSTEHARQIMTQLVAATRSTCHAKFMGMDKDTGVPLDEGYAQWVLTPEQLKADLDAAKVQSDPVQGLAKTHRLSSLP